MFFQTSKAPTATLLIIVYQKPRAPAATPYHSLSSIYGRNSNAIYSFQNPRPHQHQQGLHPIQQRGPQQQQHHLSYSIKMLRLKQPQCLSYLYPRVGPSSNTISYSNKLEGLNSNEIYLIFIQHPHQHQHVLYPIGGDTVPHSWGAAQGATTCTRILEDPIPETFSRSMLACV